MPACLPAGSETGFLSAEGADGDERMWNGTRRRHGRRLRRPAALQDEEPGGSPSGENPEDLDLLDGGAIERAFKTRPNERYSRSRFPEEYLP